LKDKQPKSYLDQMNLNSGDIFTPYFYIQIFLAKSFRLNIVVVDVVVDVVDDDDDDHR
jgi:hypothetical protein